MTSAGHPAPIRSSLLADDVRRCGRHFELLAQGGVRCRWDCGAERVYPDESAVDVEYLADHLPEHHHHHPHLHHHKEHRP